MSATHLTALVSVYECVWKMKERAWSGGWVDVERNPQLESLLSHLVPVWVPVRRRSKSQLLRYFVCSPS